MCYVDNGVSGYQWGLREQLGNEMIRLIAAQLSSTVGAGYIEVGKPGRRSRRRIHSVKGQIRANSVSGCNLQAGAIRLACDCRYQDASGQGDQCAGQAYAGRQKAQVF
jgi:hypothetical protein